MTTTQLTQEEWDERLREIPVRAIDHKSWPKHIRPLSLDDEGLGLDKDGVLYWDTKPIMIRRQFELRWIELTLAILVALGTLAQAGATIWPLIRAARS